ncbi:energy transducer TonB, partial [Kaarinaea lacus]
RNYLLGEIHSQLSKYMAYPYRARTRGWEGSVLIGFNIDRRGFLRNIHLSRTSGYSLLDNAALTAVRKVSSIPLNEWGNTFQPIALQLPVIYRLTNG